MKTGRPSLSFEEASSQAKLSEALERMGSPSRFPEHPDWRPVWSISLRIFGRTHAYNVPYLVHWPGQEGPPTGAGLGSSSN